MNISILYLCLFFAFQCGMLNLSAKIISIPDDYNTIQAGMDASSEGDTVLVSSGTYLENINFNGKNITVASKFLTTGDTAYISQTIIDGNQSGHVVTVENHETSSAALTGFTIRNGSSGDGGGIYCYGAAPTLLNLIVKNNTAVYGAGIYICGNNPTLKNITIHNNSAVSQEDDYSYGGGICLSGASPLTENVVIKNNSAEYGGGGIACFYDSNPHLSNVEISDNTATGGSGNTCNGGGVYCHEDCSISLIDVEIRGNSASAYFGEGGGIFLWDTKAILENVVISGNAAKLNGGGIYTMNESELIGTNVKILDNSAGEGGGIFLYEGVTVLMNFILANNLANETGTFWTVGGGGIYCNSSDPTLINGTIANNFAEDQGGAIFCDGSSPHLVNTILWKDLPQEIYFLEDIDFNDSSAITVSYSDLEEGLDGVETNNYGTVYWNEGNIDEDPLFKDPGNYNFRITGDSPCIDSGKPDTTGLNLPSLDLDNNERIIDGNGNDKAVIDMGAYEFDPTSVEVDDKMEEKLSGYKLFQNYPNPFNPVTRIKYNIKEAGRVSLQVYDILGRKIAMLVNKPLSAGSYEAVFYSRNLPSGFYMYRIKVNEFTKTRKMLLLK